MDEIDTELNLGSQHTKEEQQICTIPAKRAKMPEEDEGHPLNMSPTASNGLESIIEVTNFYDEIQLAGGRGLNYNILKRNLIK
jgi:hypothetical protein